LRIFYLPTVSSTSRKGQQYAIFHTIKDIVINNRDDVKAVRDDFKITRDHKRLLTVHLDKDYRIVFDKRVIMQDYSTRPILIGSGNLVGIILRPTGDKLYYSVVGHFIGEIS
jgi:hypothetical protein